MQRIVRTFRLIAAGVAELRKEPREFFGLCLLAAFIMFSYGLARPAVEALFLQTHHHGGLPYAWLAVAVVVIAVVARYNAYAYRVPVVRLFWVAGFITCLVVAELLILGHVAGQSSVAFLLYIWKDVYIVVLVELFWSIANVHYPLKAARMAYGMFCAAGSIGSMGAELGQGYLARTVGTFNTLWLVIPTLIMAGMACRYTVKEDAALPEKNAGTLQLLEGLRVVGRSKYLVPLLMLIGVVQIVITLVDYEYNRVISETYLNIDDKTAIIGQVYAAINMTALALQLTTSIILGALGVPAVMIMLPVLLFASLVFHAGAPRLLSMAIAKVMSKAFDYSLFRAAKEMFYLPLNYKEKTQGKATVDMMTYRVAKAGASLLIIWLTAVGAAGRGVVLASLTLVVGWLLLTVVISRRYQHVVGETAPQRH